MFGLIEKIFFGLLIDTVSISSHTKCVSLSNQKCMTQPTLISLNPNEYSQELNYYSFTVKLDRCVGSCDTLNDLSNKVCVSNKTEGLNLRVFNMITKINESKTSTKHKSCECKCKFDGRKCNSDQWWNKSKCRCECKNRHACEKDYVWNPAIYSCEYGKYLASTMNDLVITCDVMIEPYNEETKTILKNFNERKATCKTQKFYVFLYFINHHSIIDSC